MRWREPQERFQEKIMFEPNSGCHLWTDGADLKGYGRFRARPDTERLAHRFAWRFSYGDIPDGMQVLHKCDTPACVRPDHLFLGMNDDNQADKMRKVRHAHGARHPSAKLTEDDVRAIRASSLRPIDLAHIFNIDPSQITKVRKGIYWRNVPSESQARPQHQIT